MIHSIPENIISTMDIFQIVKSLFQNYPDITVYLEGKIKTINNKESLMKKREEYILINSKLLANTIPVNNHEDIIEAIRKEKEHFRNEVIKYVQIEKNKQIFAKNESFFIMKEKESAENLLINL